MQVEIQYVAVTHLYNYSANHLPQSYAPGQYEHVRRASNQSTKQHDSRQSTYFDSEDEDKTNIDTPNSHSDGNTPTASRGAPVKRKAKTAKRVVNPMLAHALVVARSEVPRVPKPQAFVAPIPHPPNFASDLAAGALLAMSASLGPAPKLLCVEFGSI